MTVLRLKFMKRLFSLRVLCLLIVVPAITACSTVHKLPLTPNIYIADSQYPVQNIAVSEQGTSSKIYYVTDRNQESEDDALQSYGSERSPSMAFGEATVSYDQDLSWEQLVEASQTTAQRPAVKLSSINETTRFPATPLVFTVTPNGLVVDPEQEKQYSQSKTSMQEAITTRLKAAQQKDVILYVHGFNNSFENAVLGLNDVWHFSGRHGVPIAYTWPSGSGNLLGYFTDRESGEYTVYHFKETMRALSAIPEIENIHIIAHSRGTDVSTTALRELVIEARAAGKNPRQTLKIKNLILAAPDLDYGVVTQRLIAEKFGPAFGQITIYMNEEDSALGIAQTLMKGIRFGKLTANKQSEREAQIFQNVKNVSFVNVTDVRGWIGHAYFSEHPGALSDIITLIKTGSRPGTSERPLTNIDGNFWALDRDYLKTKPPAS